MSESIKKTVSQELDKESIEEHQVDTPSNHKSRDLSQKLSLIFASIALGSDGYQANIIGAVESCLSKIYGSSVLTSALSTRVSNAMLIGDIVGQIGFGVIIDRMGRKFGIIACTFFVCLGIILATASSGVTPNGLIWMLIIARGID
jgi:MFS family permease